MPRTKFICPDGVEVPVEDCLKECRMACRCASKPTLILMSRQREWKGQVSATQGLNGVRLEYLKITKPYAEAPVNLAFALLGTFHHLKHQKVVIPEALMEEQLTDEDGTGIPDLLIDGELWDYKTCAAYKVQRALGVKREEVVIPPGKPGHGILSRGPRKGQPRTMNVWSMVEPDIADWTMQISRYAWMYRDMGFRVDRAYIQATIRDYNRRTPIQHGLDRQIYVIPIPILERDTVVEFYRDKSQALNEAIANEEMPPPCSAHETWDGKRCAGYCPVWHYCDEGIRAHQATVDSDGGEE